MSNNANARHIIRSDCANAETDLDMKASIPAGNRLESMDRSSAIYKSNETIFFSSIQRQGRGKKQINQVAGSCFSKVNSQPLND